MSEVSWNISLGEGKLAEIPPHKGFGNIFKCKSSFRFMVVVEFGLNRKKEAQYFPKFLKEVGEAKLSKGIYERDLINRAISNPKEIVEQVGKVLKIKYKEKQKELNNFLKNFKKEWRPIEREYFRKIEEATGRKWEFNKYYVYITLGLPGFADVWNRKSRAVLLSISYPLPVTKYILAHELFHLHYFYITEKESLPVEARCTALNESIAILVLVADKGLRKFWPFIDIKQVKGCYKGVDKVIGKLKPLWVKRQDFCSFVKESVKRMKRTLVRGQ